MSERTAVYRFRDAAGDLLYVGMTRNPRARFHNHAADKPWWPEVDAKAIEWLDTWAEAHAAEIAAIRAEKPRHNVQHALTVEQEDALAAAVLAADRAHAARAEHAKVMERIWGVAREMRRAGFKDLDICTTLGFSRATMNRKFGPRRADDE
jgi:predicted GIY-YIG superfamily endonuclease